MIVYHHVATYLLYVQPVVPNLDQAYRLVCYDMEDKDVQRMVASVDQKPLYPVVFPVNQHTHVICHQESQQCGYGQRQELGIG